MNRLVLSSFVCASLLAACGKKEPGPPATTSTTTAPATTAPATTAPATTAPATTAPATTAAAEDAATPPPAAGEDWLVWSRTASGWKTRWVSVTGDTFESIAERAAPIMSDGAKLWRIERADVTVDVKPCACFEDEGAPECKVVGKITRPGLRAIELGADTKTDVYPAGNEAMFGDSMDLAVDLAGGVGAKVVVDWTEGGYFCGAHGSWDSGTRVFDLAAGANVDGIWQTLDKALPRSVREPGAKELLEPLKECDGEEVTLERALEDMVTTGFGVAVTDAGAIEVTWHFTAEVMYACSSDYGVHGTSRTGLIPEAADVGLAGPLSPGLVSAIAAAGKGTVGWARVSLDGEARQRALDAFKAAPEPAWGAARFSEELSAETLADNAKSAQTMLADARKLVAQKKYPMAIGTYNMAINLDPKLARAYSGRGYAYLLEGQTLDLAKADFDKALELDATPEFQAQVWFNLGQVAEKKKDTEGARAAYTKSLALRPHEGVQKALDRLK
ncbi:MAG: tetratricopeptide repeat protein [Deltaproteobacteria bacterium]|nr:tetratricopeptide repeat protein [Deltaproteobacteria bacterium]